MRIVHVANFQYNKSGSSYDSMDQKVQHGLIQNGHYVYAFPAHDISRQNNFLNTKRLGVRAMNDSLLQTCVNVAPDFLLLGHSQSIQVETLKRIRTQLPDIRIGMWFCDWFCNGLAKDYNYIFDRIELLDTFFATTAGDKLEMFNQKGCRTSFLPNIVEPSLETCKSFDVSDHEFDLVFIGTDRKDPDRREFLRKLEILIGDRLRFGIFGSLGNPGIYGEEKKRLFSRAKAALNLTRLPEKMQWYSSDRIAQTMGNGVLVCDREEAGLSDFYGKDSLIAFKNEKDLVTRLIEVIDSGAWRDIARRGWEKVHADCNSRAVTARIVDFTFSV